MAMGGAVAGGATTGAVLGTGAMARAGGVVTTTFAVCIVTPVALVLFAWEKQ